MTAELHRGDENEPKSEIIIPEGFNLVKASDPVELSGMVTEMLNHQGVIPVGVDNTEITVLSVASQVEGVKRAIVPFCVYKVMLGDDGKLGENTFNILGNIVSSTAESVYNASEKDSRVDKRRGNIYITDAPSLMPFKQHTEMLARSNTVNGVALRGRTTLIMANMGRAERALTNILLNSLRAVSPNRATRIAKDIPDAVKYIFEAEPGA